MDAQRMSLPIVGSTNREPAHPLMIARWGSERRIDADECIGCELTYPPRCDVTQVEGVMGRA